VITLLTTVMRKCSKEAFKVRGKNTNSPYRHIERIIVPFFVKLKISKNIHVIRSKFDNIIDIYKAKQDPDK